MAPPYNAVIQRGQVYPIDCIGASIESPNSIYGVASGELWPSQLEKMCLATSPRAAVVCRNYGQAGDTSTGILSRIISLEAYEGLPYNTDPGKVAIIHSGENDPGNSIPGATTQANIVASVNAALSYGYSYVGVMSTMYLNYADSSGDTLATPYATYATLRTYQQAAVTQIAKNNVTYIDLYNFMRNLIVNQTPIVYADIINGVPRSVSYTFNDQAQSTPAPSFYGNTFGQSWQAFNDNQHPNALGTYIIALCIYQWMQNQGILTVLQQ